MRPECRGTRTIRTSLTQCSWGPLGGPGTSVVPFVVAPVRRRLPGTGERVDGWTEDLSPNEWDGIVTMTNNIVENKNYLLFSCIHVI